jgi:hypothetical protein
VRRVALQAAILRDGASRLLRMRSEIFSRAFKDRSTQYHKPHPEERALARVSKDGGLRPLLLLLAIAAMLHGSPAPLAAEAELVEQGRDLYGDFCAACHGRDMVNTGTFSFDLRKFPKDDFPRFRNSVLDSRTRQCRRGATRSPTRTWPPCGLMCAAADEAESAMRTVARLGRLPPVAAICYSCLGALVYDNRAGGASGIDRQKPARLSTLPVPGGF